MQVETRRNEIMYEYLEKKRESRNADVRRKKKKDEERKRKMRISNSDRNDHWERLNSG